MEIYDAIILGGGPAGTSAALTLEKKGINKILLVDKAHFPRDKVCGDAIAPSLVPSLERLGVMDDLLATNPSPIIDCTFIHPTFGSVIIASPNDTLNPLGYISKRVVFDNVLFQKAKERVECIEGCRIRDVKTVEKGLVEVSDGERKWVARTLVAADGAQGVVRRKIGNAAFDEMHTAVAIRLYCRGVKELRPSIEIYFLDELQPGYLWIFPTDRFSGEANVGLGILSYYMRNKGVDLKHMLKNLLQNHPLFMHRFEGASFDEPIRGWSLPLGSHLRPLGMPGILFVGDAAGLIDPFTGEGIGNAIASGTFAAEEIAEGLKKGRSNDEIFQRYTKAVARRLIPPMKISHAIQKAIRYPLLLKGMFHLLNRSERLRNVVARRFY